MTAKEKHSRNVEIVLGFHDTDNLRGVFILVPVEVCNAISAIVKVLGLWMLSHRETCPTVGRFHGEILVEPELTKNNDKRVIS